MLFIGLAAVILATIVELSLMPLFGVVGLNRIKLGLLLAAGNLTITLLVGYFVANAFGVFRRHTVSDATLAIVQDTLPLMRQGLNQETARKIAGIVTKLSEVRGVVISDLNGVLAAAGPDSGYPQWVESLERLCREAITNQKTTSRRLGPDFVITDSGSGVMAIPLDCRGTIVGALALSEVGTGPPSTALERTGKVLAQLLTIQIELSQLDRQAQLTTEAELNALRAQINPHFLFNTLNTIAAYSREDPETTRRMLVKLADLFRSSMKATGQMVTFYEEYHNVKSYLYLEQARFRDRLKVVYDIDPQVLKVSIPALSIQPIVENAVKHGLGPKVGTGTLRIQAYIDFLTLRLNIIIKDDGVGIHPSRLKEIIKLEAGPGSRAAPSNGVGLSNVNERMKRLYGNKYSLNIESRPGRGTKVHLRVPVK